MFELEVKKDYSERIRYNVPNMPVFICKNEHEALAGTAVECHWHDEVEFILMLSGKLNYNVNGEHVTLNEGDALFVNSKQLHFGYAVEDGMCRYICVTLNTKLLCANNHMDRSFFAPVLENGMSYFHLSHDVEWCREVNNDINALWEIFEKNEKSCALHTHSRFYKMWSVLYANIGSKNTDTQPSYNTNLDTLKEMVGFIHTNYAKKLSLDDIYTAGAVCRSRCCSIFKDFFNQTPIEYLTMCRLNKSTALLQSTEMPITEIAHATGFAGASYFSEVFKKHYSCSPSEFREKARNRN